MRLWTAVHLGASPASKAIRRLDDWQVGLLYEVAMGYPVESLRKSYWERKKSVSNFADDDLLDMGYTLDEIVRIKGNG